MLCLRLEKNSFGFSVCRLVVLNGYVRYSISYIDNAAEYKTHDDGINDDIDRRNDAQQQAAYGRQLEILCVVINKCFHQLDKGRTSLR